MRRPVVALITAYNEAETIAGVIAAVSAAALVDRVQVIDDASEDSTFDIASRRAGERVRVLRLPRRVPVGRALLAHLDQVTEPDAILFFCDADLRGLTPQHVDSILRPVCEHRAAMAVGLKDKAWGGRPVRWLTERLLPRWDVLIGGERAMYREIADSVLDAPHSSGYGLVIVLNRFCRRHRLPVEVVFMPGCNHRHKVRKWGPRRAIPGVLRLCWEIPRALAHTALVPRSVPAKKFDRIPELDAPR